MPAITTSAIVAAIVAIAMKAAHKASDTVGEELGDGLAAGAKAVFGKVKALLGLKSDAASPGLKQEVEQVLAAKPELAEQVRQIIPPAYWQNTGTVNMYVEKGSAIGHNSGTQTNNYN